MMRTALKEVIEKEPDLMVIGEAGDGQQAVRMSQACSPDIIIMDISMPVMDGVTATKRIKAVQPLTAILILTVHTDVVTIFKILEAGASGYLIKSIYGAEVTDTIRAVMNGDTVLAPGVSEAVLRYALRSFRKPVELRSPCLMTQKEVEILSLAARGMANKEIARRLGVSEGTIKNHFVEMFQKLNVRSRTEAIFVSFKSGILSIGDLE